MTVFKVSTVTTVNGREYSVHIDGQSSLAQAIAGLETFVQQGGGAMKAAPKTRKKKEDTPAIVAPATAPEPTPIPQFNVGMAPSAPAPGAVAQSAPVANAPTDVAPMIGGVSMTPPVQQAVQQQVQPVQQQVQQPVQQQVQPVQQADETTMQWRGVIHKMEQSIRDFYGPEKSANVDGLMVSAMHQIGYQAPDAATAKLYVDMLTVDKLSALYAAINERSQSL